MKYIVPYAMLRRDLEELDVAADKIDEVIRKLLRTVSVDAQWYIETYRDVGDAIKDGLIENARQHFIENGYFEGRMPFAHEVDEVWYGKAYPDIAESYETGDIMSLTEHYIHFGYQEGRLPGNI